MDLLVCSETEDILIHSIELCTANRGNQGDSDGS